MSKIKQKVPLQMKTTLIQEIIYPVYTKKGLKYKKPPKQ